MADKLRGARLPWDRDCWKISYGDTALYFGNLKSGYVFNTAPDMGTREFARIGDAARPRSDGMSFGQDFIDGRTITFDLTVNGPTEDECVARLGRLSTVWRADKVRLTTGAVATLESERGRLLYGRPRRFASTDADLCFGVCTVTMDFQTADDNWYGDENTETIDFMPVLGGGLVAPLASPLSTTSTSDRSRAFEVGGQLATWPLYDIRGPITNPTVEIVGKYKITLHTTLRADQVVTLDTRPFARTVVRDGRSIAGTLSRDSIRLSQAALDPGRYEMVLRGQTAARTASASVRWRNAYTTP